MRKYKIRCNCGHMVELKLPNMPKEDVLVTIYECPHCGKGYWAKVFVEYKPIFVGYEVIPETEEVQYV